MQGTKHVLFMTVMMAAVAAITGCQSSMSQSNMEQSPTVTQQHSASHQITPAVLSRYHWVLASALYDNNQPVESLAALLADNQQVTLDFMSDTLSASVGCNHMSTQYELTDNVLLTDGTTISTMMGCGEVISQAETVLNRLITGSNQLMFKAGDTPILTQITDNGVTLVWQGTLTSQAKYNQQGDTVYWEVSHQTQRCSETSPKSCLKVRAVNYDQQGIKTSVGQWGLYAGNIQGYTHDEHSDQVLRLQRYVVNPSDVKGGRNYAYVLDTVVESTMVQ